MANFVLLSRGVNAESIYTKYTLTWDYIGLSLKGRSSGNITLFQLPAGSKVEGVQVKHTEQFAGLSGSLKVSVGSPANPQLFTIPTQDLVATPVTNTNILEQGGLFTSGTIAAEDVVLNVISSIGSLDRLTAGSVDVYVKYFYVKTPQVDAP